MRKKVVLSLSVMVTLAAIVTIVFAVGPYDFVPAGSDLYIWGYAEDVVFLDVNGSVDGSGNPTYTGDEVVYFGIPNKAGFFSGFGTVRDSENHVWEDRAEIAIGRMTTVQGTPSNAWMQSSGNAKILVQHDGDIIITLGN